jgi:hypothetical protein
MGKDSRGMDLKSLDDVDESQLASRMQQATAIPGIGGRNAEPGSGRQGRLGKRIRLAGAPGRIRTADASLRTAALYPLSYGGVRGSYASRRMPIVAPPLPDLLLYTRPGCHLCDEGREAIEAVLADRRDRDLPVPMVVERNIELDPELHRTYLERIPVVDLGGYRIELIVTVGKLRRLFTETLDASEPETAKAERA